MNKAYEELADAVVIQAVEDIRKGNKYAEDARRFMKSDWFSLFSNIDGRTILKRLDKEIANKRKKKMTAEAM